MRIITIDRTSHNHGEYTATISLSYDEAVIIQNIFYHHAKTNKSIDEKNIRRSVENYVKHFMSWNVR